MTKLKEDFEASGGVWKEWRIGELFQVKTTKGIDAGKIHLKEKGMYEFVGRTKANYGVQGFVDKLDVSPNSRNVFSVSQIGSVHAQIRQNEWYASQNIFQLEPSSLKLLSNYIEGSINKALSIYADSCYSFYPTLASLKDLKVLIPYKGAIDYSFMEQYITLLKEEKMLQVDKFLKDSGLNDTTLSAEETAALEKFRNGEVRFEERKIGDLFEKIKTHKLPYKAESLPKVKIGNNTLPCLTSSFQNQGLNYYVPESNATVLQNVITIPSNSDVYRAYFQSVRFTVLSDAYAIERKDKGLKTTGEQYLFMVACINKVTDKSFYSYKNKLGGWNVVQEKEFNLPVNSDGDIDYTFMQHFISALEKLVMRGVVKYKDEMLNANLKTYSFGTDCYNVAAEPNLQNK